MTDPGEKQALDDIEKYGRHIIQVMEEGDYPPFSYSIGIAKTYNKPDLCVIGLKEPIAQFVINEYAFMLKDDFSFEIGKLYSGFLEGFDICFETVDKKHFDQYFGWAIWYYKGRKFNMLQLIWPTTSGIYPWAQNAPESFLEWQPVLTHDGKTTITA